MDDVTCGGHETDLSECQYTSRHNCAHGEDVGVICSGSYGEDTTDETTDDTTDEGEIDTSGDNSTEGDVGRDDTAPEPVDGMITVGDYRLVQDRHSSYAYKGRVEVNRDGQWGTVCDDGFNNAAARVFCSSLGLPSDLAHEVPGYGRTVNSGSGPIQMDDMSCSGDESFLHECTYTVDHNCGHAEDVGVVCIGSSEDGGETTDDTTDEGGDTTTDETTDEGGDTTTDETTDEGGDTTTDETTDEGTDDNGPVIENGMVTRGNFRLVQDRHSSYAYKGRVEVNRDGEWGTVCDDGFNDAAARVFCYSLGLPYDYAHDIAGYGRTINSGSGPIHMDDMQCNGGEHDLTQCAH